MKDHLLAGFTAGLLVWAIVGFVNSSMAKAGEQKRIQIITLIWMRTPICIGKI